MSNQESELKVIRDQIDLIDQEIQSLLNRRAQCAQQVAEVKMKYQGQQETVYYRPEREAQVLRRVMDRNQGPLPAKEVARLFREIMSVCLALESPLQVAFLGPEGTFTQQAVQKHFGHSAVCVPQTSLDDVFREVQAGNAHYGVVPIENSSEGVVSHTLDLFKRFNLNICGEVELVTHHHLLGLQTKGYEGVTKLYAHAQSMAQCRRWIEAHLPNVEKVAVSSNAEASRLAAAGGETCVAIAGAMAAELYELHIQASNVEDQADTSTRFLIIGMQKIGSSGLDKTSILISAQNKPGTLYKLLQPFYQHQISLTRVESRPCGQECLFYIDFEGHSEEPRIKPVLSELISYSTELKLLGSYPVAVL